MLAKTISLAEIRLHFTQRVANFPKPLNQTLFGKIRAVRILKWLH